MLWDDVPSACSYTCVPTSENKQIGSFLKKIYKPNTLQLRCKGGGIWNVCWGRTPREFYEGAASWHQASGRYDGIYYNACRKWAHKTGAGDCEFNSTTGPPGLLQRQTTLSVLRVSVKQKWSRDRAIKSTAVNVTKHHGTGGVEVSSMHSGHL
jgi:hypothetical protein